MADISKIKLPSGSTYDIKDAVAREAISGGVTFIIAWDGDSAPVVGNIPKGIKITYSGIEYTGTKEASSAQAGAFYLIATSDTALNLYEEYVAVTDGELKKWEKLGSGNIDLSGYAKKGDGITAAAASSSTGISVSAHSVTSASVSASGTTTASGSNAASAVTISPKTTDVYSMSSTGSVTAGTANTPTVIDTSKFSGGSGSFASGAFSGGSGSFTQGTDTHTTTTYSVSNETLTITAGSFTQGTDTHTHTAATHGADSHSHNAASLSTGFYTAGRANTPTAVTLPSRSSKISAWTGYNTGVSNTYAAAQSFTGASSPVDVTGTATVSIANHTITDSGHTHSVDGTIDS